MDCGCHLFYLIDPNVLLHTCFQAMSESKQPKTREEILEEKLREINTRLTTVKNLLHTKEHHQEEKLQQAIKRRKTSKGEPRYLSVNSKMVEGTDRLEALIQMEEALEILLDFQGKDPVKEAEQLISKKIRILKELLPYSKNSGLGPK